MIECLVIDDGSTDDTVAAAVPAGPTTCVKLGSQPRACARLHGGPRMRRSTLGADIIVNTDADNQDAAAVVEQLVAPILTRGGPTWSSARGRSAIWRPFSPMKKLLQRLGSWVVRRASRTGDPRCP